MLCDGCDSGFHTSCIGLSTVPFGDWFCRRCINLGVDKLASCLEKTEEEPAPTFKHVAYLRVSSKAQDAPQYGRVGLYTQNATILRWAAENQIILESTTCEVGSAYVNKPLDQLNKLVNVIKVYDLTGSNFVEQEMALVKVKAHPEHRAEILRLVDIFRCKVVDVSATHYTIEATGTREKLRALLELLQPMGIKEIARTGSIALSREKK